MLNSNWWLTCPCPPLGHQFLKGRNWDLATSVSQHLSNTVPNSITIWWISTCTNEWMDEWPSLCEMRPGKMETGHAYVPLCVHGWGDQDSGSLKRLCGGRVCLKVLVTVEDVGGSFGAVFPQQQGWLWTHSGTHLARCQPGAKSIYWQHSWAGFKVQQSDQFSPTWNPWTMLCLPSESVWENGHLNLPRCRNSTCHLPLKFLEVLLGLLIGWCHMVTSRIMLWSTF